MTTTSNSDRGLEVLLTWAFFLVTYDFFSPILSFTDMLSLQSARVSIYNRSTITNRVTDLTTVSHVAEIRCLRLVASERYLNACEL